MVKNKAQRIKVLIVGQTPPPYHGQAIMIEKIISGPYDNIDTIHVPLSFSVEIDEVGVFKFKKIYVLFKVIFAIYLAKFKHKPTVLYYPPSGPNLIPILRDIFILTSTRWLFNKTVFHFHAGGLSTIYQDLNRFSRFFFRRAYFNPDCCILLSELNPSDGKFLKSKTNLIIPYGIKDEYALRVPTEKASDEVCLLFVGMISESKGVLILLNALNIVKNSNPKTYIKLKIVGRFESAAFEKRVKQEIEQLNLKNHVHFTGVLTGEDKWDIFQHSHIFCFPTFYESETFGLVVLEAMQFSLPCIVSDWRGVPSLVTHGETGYIIPHKSSKSLAEAILELANNPEKMSLMGNQGRKKYLEHYSSSIFLSRIEAAFTKTAD